MSFAEDRVCTMIRRCPECRGECSITLPNSLVFGKHDTFRLDNPEHLSDQLSVDQMRQLHQKLKDKRWTCLGCRITFTLIGPVTQDNREWRVRMAQTLFGPKETNNA